MIDEIKALIEKIRNEGRISEDKAKLLLDSIEDTGRLIIGSDEEVVEVLL